MGIGARRTALRLVPFVVLLAALLALPSTSRATAPGRDSGVSALFFGDSLMNGTGSRPTRPVMARVAARSLGWDVTVDAFGGTGYTTGGQKGRPYLDRLKEPGLLSSRYDVVLVEGGTNDRAADLGVLHARATETVQYVRQRLPGTTLVLMGAFDPKGRRSDPRRIGVDGVLKAVAREQGVPFFSPISGGWTKGQGARFLSPDGLHPSTYGYGVMGARLAQALKQVPGLPKQ